MYVALFEGFIIYFRLEPTAYAMGYWHAAPPALFDPVSM
jgi:hypothetical protein